MSRAIAPAEQDLLSQSRALGDPTRLAVFAHLRDAPSPLTVTELAEHFSLHHNAIRQHLARLVDAGLVVGEAEPPAGPGRPARRYRATPGAAERWGGASAFEALSMMLLEVLRGERTPREVGRDAGRRLAAGHRAGAGALEVLEAVDRQLGFEPRAQRTPTGADLVLERCPFAEAAAAAPDVVCDLHRGLAEGIVEQAAGGGTIDDLVVRPPRRAGCRIQVSALPDDDPA
jgi:predicted ArsR family transcriptional regulator